MSAACLQKEQKTPRAHASNVCCLLFFVKASYDCCCHCGHEKLRSEKAIWLLGLWRGLLLGVLHAFQLDARIQGRTGDVVAVAFAVSITATGCAN